MKVNRIDNYDLAESILRSFGYKLSKLLLLGRKSRSVSAVSVLTFILIGLFIFNKYESSPSFGAKIAPLGSLMQVESMIIEPAKVGVKQSEIHNAINFLAKPLNKYEKEIVTSAVYKYSELFGHDPYLVLAIIQTESNFRKGVISKKGAVGLMQLRPFVAKGLANELNLDPNLVAQSLTDLETNVLIGTHYLSKLKRRFGNLRMALEAYNLGPTRLKRRIDRGDYLLNKYSKKVLTRWKVIAKIATKKA